MAYQTQNPDDPPTNTVDARTVDARTIRSTMNEKKMPDELNTLIVEAEKAEGNLVQTLTIIQALMVKTRLVGPSMPYQVLKDTEDYLNKAQSNLERWKTIEKWLTKL